MTERAGYWEIYRAAYRRREVSPEEANSIKHTYQKQGRERVLEQAKRKKLIPALACLFTKLDIDAEYWDPIVGQYRARNERVIECLDSMYRLLAEEGVNRIAVVENFGALLASSEDIAMFGSGDVDEYADPTQREIIKKILKDNGYIVKDTKNGSLYISTIISKEGSFPEGFHFGINWDVTNRLNLPCFTAKGDFIDWDRAIYYRDTAIRIPSPEGLMYVCLMHIAVHGFCKAPDIRLYYDIANAAEQQINWHKIVEWAERDQNCVKISTAAYLAHKLLEVEFPSFVYEIGDAVQKKRLLSVVYNEDENILNDFPGRLDRIKIDVFTNEFGAARGVRDILFPDSSWIKAKYGSLPIGYLKHIVSLI